jgi:exodeoxyribonuclease V alpha subunit
MILRRLREACTARTLPELALHFAERLCSATQPEPDPVVLAAALASQQVSEGAVCVDLQRQAGNLLFPGQDFPGIQAPELQSWLEQLYQSRVCGGPEADKPLVLEEHKLYLSRYWHFEQELAHRLRRLASAPPMPVDEDRLRQDLQRLFPATRGETDWQRVAAVLSVLRRLTVISGGPGTGKTHTVTAILALLLEQSREHPLRIEVAAPTGKAALRLTESIRDSKSRLDLSDQVRDKIPDEALTLHRLLGVRPNRSQPRFGPDNPLHLDLLVIDEASMVDLPLLYRAVRALPDKARLILLGDRDQLASVEAGSVFADICGGDQTAYTRMLGEKIRHISGDEIPTAETTPPLNDCIVVLNKSRRFHSDSGIGNLAQLVNRADFSGASRLLQAPPGDLAWHSSSQSELREYLRKFVKQAIFPLFEADTPDKALQQLERARVLCAVRQGPTGVETINREIEESLRDEGLTGYPQKYYRGQPVMVTRNDYGAGLFNGDIGIFWPDPASGDGLRAWFRSPDGSLRALTPGRLPPWETAFAMTVHKAQGSEFERLLLILPESDTPVLTRELVYTGITRASAIAEIWGSWESLQSALERKVIRTSGLADKLRIS